MQDFHGRRSKLWVPKIRTVPRGDSIFRRASRNSRNRNLSIKVWIADSNGLIFVRVVFDKTFSQNVEGSTKKNVVGGGSDDVKLKV